MFTNSEVRVSFQSQVLHHAPIAEKCEVDISVQQLHIAVSLLTALCICVEEIAGGPCGRHAFFLRDVSCVPIASGALQMVV